MVPRFLEGIASCAPLMLLKPPSRGGNTVTVYAEDGQTVIATYFEVPDEEISSGRFKAWLIEKHGEGIKPRARREGLIGGTR